MEQKGGRGAEKDNDTLLLEFGPFKLEETDNGGRDLTGMIGDQHIVHHLTDQERLDIAEALEGGSEAPPEEDEEPETPTDLSALTVDEAVEHIKAITSLRVLNAVLRAEEKGKDRTGVKDAVAKRRVEIES